MWSTPIVELAYFSKYYIGEVNEHGRPHGMGLLIDQFTGIIEGHFTNGVPYNQWKILAIAGDAYLWSSLGWNIVFFEIGNYCYDGFYGYTKCYGHEGQLISEGYTKGRKFSGESRVIFLGKTSRFANYFNDRRFVY